MRAQSILAGLMLLGTPAFGVVLTVPGDKADNSIGKNTSGVLVPGYVAQTEMTAGDDNAASSKSNQCAVVVFRLPDLSGQSVSNADLAVSIQVDWPGGTDPFPKGIDLYAVRRSSSATVVTNDYGFKGTGPGTLIQNNVMVMTNNAKFGRAVYGTDSSGDAALANWLNMQYAAGAGTGDFVFLRYELDANTANPAFLSSADCTTNPVPVLTFYTAAAVTQSVSAISLSQFGITWTIAGTNQTGQYANGDYWIAGPASIISISNTQHVYGVLPSAGMDGSEINPGVDTKQGYDIRLFNYQASRNRSYPNGAGISSTNPLVLNVNESLVSSISWLPGEPGCPAIDANPGGPRPSIYSMAILTCVSNAPPAGSFRPPYCGTNKTARFNQSQLDYSKLGNLVPVAGTPALTNVEARFAGPWIDHVNTWIGGYTHPYIHMENYGRDLSVDIGDAALMLQLDFTKLPGSPSKTKLLTEIVQLGIDFAGIADAGGGWPCDGGHGQGRKWPILCAGTLLNDAHMKSAGSWTNNFQEDMDTFYVAQTNVDITHSAAWVPDNRAPSNRYEVANIGLPEWGIRHETYPEKDNLNWTATYRVINNQSYPGWVLAAHIMGLKSAWNHNALFDYIDRSTAVGYPPYTSGFSYDSYVFGNSFVRAMWKAYRSNYPPQWMPFDAADLYSQGALVYPETGFLFQLNTLP